MLLKKVVANFFLSGALSLTTENRRRIILLNGILLIGFFALSGAGTSAFLRGNIVLAVTDGCIALLAIILITWLRLSHGVRAVGIASIIITATLFTFLVITGGDKNTGPLWLYLYPLFAFFLVGGRTAIWLSLGMIVLTTTLLFFPDLLQTTYDPAFRGRLLGSLLVLTGITYIFEYSRKDAQDKMLLAQKETDDIFHAMREGLFLINRRNDRFLIGSKFSSAVADMLGEPQLAEKEFSAVLHSLQPGLDIAGIEKYLGLFFNPDLDEGMLVEINPIKQIEAKRTLAFGFHRIMKMDLKTGEAAGIESIMCVMQDKTEEINLQKELATQGENQSKQMLLLLQILHTNPALMANFLETASGYESEVMRMLRDAATADAGLLDTAFRKIHTIKGDARALGLEIVGDKAHATEEKISELKKMDAFSGTDMLPLVIALADLEKILAEVKDMTQKIRSHGDSAKSTTQTPLKDMLYNLVRQLNQSTGKQVVVDTAAFDESQLHVAVKRPVQEILTQMVRNSFVHGIETTGIRSERGKSEKGKISVRLSTEGQQLQIFYADDGNGLDTESLKKQAIDRGIATAEELAAWPMAKIYTLIFRKGLSTAPELTGDAGRGVGMDIVQENIRKLGGRIRMRTKATRGIEFVFEFDRAN